MAAFRGLFRAPFLVTAGFSDNGLVAETSFDAEPVALGGIGLFISAGEALAADRAVPLCEPGPVRAGGTGGAGTAIGQATRRMAVSAQADAPGFTAGVLAR